jgi:hypothetical protein
MSATVRVTIHTTWSQKVVMVLLSKTENSDPYIPCECIQAGYVDVVMLIAKFIICYGKC